MFMVLMGQSRDDLLALSVPEMVDTIDYCQEVRSRNGGQ